MTVTFRTLVLLELAASTATCPHLRARIQQLIDEATPDE